MRRIGVLLALGLLAMPPAFAGEPAASLPVAGFLRSTPSAPFANIVAAFVEGLASRGYVDGKSVRIEYRWADGDVGRLPALAAELAASGAGVIVGNSLAIEAARAATGTVPLVFVAADDPVRTGLAPDFARPGGMTTGVTFFGGSQLGGKRLDLLHGIAPGARRVAVMIDERYPPAEAELPALEPVAASLGIELVVVRPDGDDFDAAFEAVAQSGAAALLVSGSPFFTSQSRRLVTLAAAARLPAIYDQRSFVEAGGLASYGASFTEAYRQAGIYAGRILGGERPGDLPVVRPTAVELVVSLPVAKSLGLELSPVVVGQADEVIE
ncbi:ABC transporter substrate-binding protein [Acuticoccus sediminis]|uniref:ABC transporter substrate-binding protein n=1 Tax=Acuticoccus sediminis TaxID=2184697 RepID=A0A8B2NSZ9_9HYPH|nr:ABC transporter substrate-binding protein [Acuticoccus sediminis]RAI01649.1 ABC transporter substrate-binding protein [Acuticoccus sediminis]